MHPIPCSHCGNNFMRPTLDPEAPKLCNNCLIREQRRNPEKMNTTETIDVIVTCPRQVQINIEEHCINQGIDFSKYFLGLHYEKIGKEVSKEYFKEEIEEEEKPKNNPKGKKK